MTKWIIDEAGMNTLLTIPEPYEVLQAVWNLDVEDKSRDEVFDGMRLETIAIINLLADHIKKVDNDV